MVMRTLIMTSETNTFRALQWTPSTVPRSSRQTTPQEPVCFSTAESKFLYFLILVIKEKINPVIQSTYNSRLNILSGNFTGTQ